MLIGDYLCDLFSSEEPERPKTILKTKTVSLRVLMTDGDVICIDRHCTDFEVLDGWVVRDSNKDWTEVARRVADGFFHDNSFYPGHMVARVDLMGTKVTEIEHDPS